MNIKALLLDTYKQEQFGTPHTYDAQNDTWPCLRIYKVDLGEIIENIEQVLMAANSNH